MKNESEGKKVQKLNKTAIQQSLLFCICFIIFLLCFAVALPAYASQGGEMLPSGSAIIDDSPPAGHQTPLAMVTDSAGNVIVTGFTGASGAEDYYTLKFKADGSGTLWRVQYDGPAASNKKDKAVAVAVDSANNVIVTGYIRNASDTNYDIYTAKYNVTTGAMMAGWPNTYNNVASNGNDYPVAVVVDQATNIVYVGGYTATNNLDDFVIISYNSNGTMNNTWGGAGIVTYDHPTVHGDDRITSIAVLSTGGSPGLAAAGYTWNNIDFDGLTIKFNLNGTVKWSKQVANATGYNKTGDNRESLVRMDAAGNVIVAGYIYNGSNKNMHVMRLDKDTGSATVGGWEQWQIGGYQDELPGGLFVDSSSVYMAGSIYSGVTSYDLFIGKYDLGTGEQLETAILRTSGGNDDIPSDIKVNASGEVFVTGDSIDAITHYKDWLTAKYSANLDLLWSKTFDGLAFKNDSAVGIGLFAGAAYVAGSSDKNAGSSDLDYYMIKYDAGTLNRPTRLTAKTISTTQINLEWTDNSTGESGFCFERCVNAGCDFGTKTVITATANPHSDAVSPDTIYRYRAYARIGGTCAAPTQQSYYSDVAEANTTALNPTAPTWKFISNEAAGNDDAVAIAVGPDQNPVITGSKSIGAGDNMYFTIKLDRTDDTNYIWKGPFDNAPTFGETNAFAVAVDSNNDVIVSGNAQGPSNTDIFSLKYLAAGISKAEYPIWVGEIRRYNVVFGSSTNKEDTPVAVAVDGSDNIFVVGYGENDKSGRSDYDIYVVKYTSDGTLDWENIYDGTFGHDQPSGVVVDAYGNPYITGKAHNGTNTTFFTTKYCGATALPGCGAFAKGQRIWTKTYNGQGSGDNYATAIDIGPSGNIYVTGSATNTNNRSDFYTIKYNGQTGAEIWEKPFGGSAVDDYKAVSVKVDRIDQLNDDGILVAGTIRSTGANPDFYVIKYDQNGNIVWQRDILKPTTNDTAVAMALDPSGNVCVAGDSGTAMLAVKLAYADGSIITYGGNAGTLYNTGNPNITSAAVSNEYGEIYVAGSTKGTNFDMVVFQCLGDTIALPTPFILTPVAGVTTQTINMTWQKTMLPVSPAPTFTLLRKDVTGLGSWTTVLASSSLLAYSDTGLAADNNYCYSLVAHSGAIDSRELIKCKITMKARPSLDPLTVMSTTEIDVSWANLVNNLGYKLERSTGGCGGPWTGTGIGPFNGIFPPVPYPDVTTTGYNDTSRSPGTTYCYRVSVLNLGGYSLPSLTLSASTITVAPVQNAPSAISSSSVTINWSGVTGATTYRIERCTTGCTNDPGDEGNWSFVANDASSPYVNGSGLVYGSLYYYRLKAYNGALYSAPSNIQFAKTRLLTPTITTPVAVTTTTMTPAWDDPNISPNQTSYTVQYQACAYNYPSPYCDNYTWDSYWSGGAGGWSSITAIAGQSTPIGGLTSGRTYRLRVTAVCAAPCSNTGTDSDPSSAIGVTTALTAPSTVTASTYSASQILVEWNNIIGEMNYDLIKDGVPMNLGLGKDYIYPGYGTPSQYIVGGLLAGTEYCFQVRAYNGLPGGDVTSSPAKCATTQAGPPTGLTVTATSNTQITISWNDTADVGYEVWETHLNDQNDTNKTNPASGWSSYAWLVTTVQNDTTHTHTVCPGDTYKYMVRTIISTGPNVYSGFSSEAQATTTPPPAATLGPVTVVSQTRIDLSWGTAAVDSYVLQRCSTGSYGSTSTSFCTNAPNRNGNWTTIQDNASLQYVDSTRVQGTIYAYRVRGRIGCGYSTLSASNIIYKTTVPKIPTLTATAQSTSVIRTNWAQTSGEEGYYILSKKLSAGSCAGEYMDDPVDGQTTKTQVTPGTTVFKDITGLLPGSTYCFKICSYNNGNMQSPYSSVISRMTTLPQPQNLTATVQSETQVLLSWDPITGNDGYRVERSLDNFATAPSFTTTTAQNAVSYTDNTGLQAGTKYYYRIQAKNSDTPAGYSVYSDPPASVTTRPAAPTSLILNLLSQSSGTVSWQEVDVKWQVSKGATEYRVERYLLSNPLWAPLWANFAVPYEQLYCGYYTSPTLDCPTLINKYTNRVDNTGLLESSEYCYQVKAWNSDGGSSLPSEIQCITTLSKNAPFLVCPDITNTECLPIKSRQVDLLWSPAKCLLVVGQCKTPDGYEVESKEGAGGHWVNKAVIANPNATVFTDTIGIQPDTTYTYRVRSYRLDINDNFASGIDPLIWSQATAASFGTASVTAVGGAVRLNTTSTGSGSAGSYNWSAIYLQNPDTVSGDFDMQVDYDLPSGTQTNALYNVYARLVVYFDTSGGNQNWAFVERRTSSSKEYYLGNVLINGVVVGEKYYETTDTSGKLRITRNGSTVSLYTWKDGDWYILQSGDGATLKSTATTVNVVQYAQQTSNANLTADVDNFKLNMKSAFSNQRTTTTIPWAFEEETCH